ncbi:MAG TPA: DUF4198 domain-containing protein [Bryobacteraceae bacterium]|jgi:uncharacterized GH25 family protein|nr:DUF4198 domain-containing protein [Bryobacteraceae bacterium]
MLDRKHVYMRKSLLFLLVVARLAGHDLYLMPKKFRVDPGETLTVAFHSGDDFPKAQHAPKLDRMLEPTVFTAGGKAPLKNLRMTQKYLLADVTIPEPGSAIVSVRSRPSLINLQPAQFTKYLKNEGLDHVIRWRADNNQSGKVGRERYSKYVKSLVVSGKSNDTYRQLVGFPIEIVPEKDPALARVGDNMPVRVLFRGKPAADLQVEMAWLAPDGKVNKEPAGRTDQNGHLEIPIRSSGTWKLHTVLMKRCQEPSVADWESFWASLTFQVH